MSDMSDRSESDIDMSESARSDSENHESLSHSESGDSEGESAAARRQRRLRASSRRRASRAARFHGSYEEPLPPPTKTRIIDDSDPSDFESEEESDLVEIEDDDDVPRTRRRPRATQPAARRRKVGSTLPLARVPEDVPWKEPQGKIPEDLPIIENAAAVAFLVIFTNTFADLFADLPPLGPQDIEEGCQAGGDLVEQLFLRLLGLVLNRKKEIEQGRYASALSELHALVPLLGAPACFPDIAWKSKTAFEELGWREKLGFMQALALWALANSQRVRAYLPYLDDDAFAPWLGSDNENCRYYFVQGVASAKELPSRFRLYKETNRLLAYVSWTSVAASSEEVAAVAQSLEAQGSAAGKLGRTLADIVPELAALEEKARRELRRQQRRDMLGFDRPRTDFESSRRTRRSGRVDYSMRAFDNQLDEAIGVLSRPKRGDPARHQPESPEPGPRLSLRQQRIQRQLEERREELHAETPEDTPASDAPASDAPASDAPAAEVAEDAETAPAPDAPETAEPVSAHPSQPEQPTVPAPEPTPESTPAVPAPAQRTETTAAAPPVEPAAEPAAPAAPTASPKRSNLASILNDKEPSPAIADPVDRADAEKAAARAAETAKSKLEARMPRISPPQPSPVLSSPMNPSPVPSPMQGYPPQYWAPGTYPYPPGQPLQQSPGQMGQPLGQMGMQGQPLQQPPGQPLQMGQPLGQMPPGVPMQYAGQPMPMQMPQQGYYYPGQPGQPQPGQPGNGPAHPGH